MTFLFLIQEDDAIAYWHTRYKRTLEIEHFYKGHDGDFIHIKNIFFDHRK